MYRVRVVCVGCVLLIGCARHSPAPVEVKVDNKYIGLNQGVKKVPVVEDIPALEPSLKTSKKIRSYVMKEKETLFDIAYRYDLDPMNLAALNGIEAPYNVKPGQVLMFPDANFKNVKNHSGGEKTLYQEKPYNNFKNNKMPEKEVKEERESSRTSEVAILSSPKIKSKDASLKDSKSSSKEREGSKTKSIEAKKPTSGMIFPTKGKIVSNFGALQDGIANDGINISASLGTPVKAVKDGRVLYVGNKLEEYGNVVIIKHDNNLITTYAHLHDINVKKDAAIKMGDTIGHVGKTGDVKTPQLHFEVMKDKVPVNPNNYLK